MAIPAQKVTVTWGGNALAELATIKIDQPRGGESSDRTGTWTLNLGTVDIAAFTTASIPDTDYGKRRRLIVKCPASASAGATILTLFDADCLYHDKSVELAVNDAVKFAFKFRIVDTQGATT